MNAKTLSVGLVVLAGWLLISSHAFAQQTPPDSAKAKQIVALVKKAAALIESQCPLACRSAFAEFRRTGSEWRTGDTYLFVADTKGMALFDAGFPHLEGTDVSALKDANGKLINVELARAAPPLRSPRTAFDAPSTVPNIAAQKRCSVWLLA